MCRMIKPKFDSLSKENEDIIFVYADAEKFPGTREFAEVSNLPTFAGFKDGKLVANKMGAKAETIEEVLNAITSH
jgi:thioredoxin 1